MNRFDALSPEVQSLILTACCEDATQAQLTQLEELVGTDFTMRLLVDYLQLDGELHRIIYQQSSEDKCLESLGFGVPGDWPAIQQFKSISPSPAFPSSALHNPLNYLPESWSVSYLIATVICGIGILIGAFTDVSHPGQIAERLPVVASDHVAVDPQMEFVGRITGMVDCKWEDSSDTPISGRVLAGQKLILSSGLMEITYDTGAKVILQGPVAYKVDSAAGGYLSLGKLTARVQAAKPQAANPQSPIPNPSLPTTHYPLFTVKTPVAVVTDLGTEFGVEVTSQGSCQVKTFVGAVEVVPHAGDGRIVRSGEAVQIGRGGSACASFVQAGHFVRSMDMRRIELRPYGKAVLEDRPVAYWPLGESPGVRRIVDHSGNGHDGIAIGVLRSDKQRPLAGGQSRALEFSGHGYVQIDDLPSTDPAKGMTIEAWAWVEGAETPQSVMSDRSLGFQGYMLYATASAWEFSTGAGPDGNTWDSIFAPLVRKQWTHIVGTFEPTGTVDGTAFQGIKKLYINGDLTATERQRLAASSKRLLRIGAGATELSMGGEFLFRGRIAEVAVYDRPLCADRVKTHWMAGQGLNATIEGPQQDKGSGKSDSKK